MVEPTEIEDSTLETDGPPISDSVEIGNSADESHIQKGETEWAGTDYLDTEDKQVRISVTRRVTGIAIICIQLSCLANRVVLEGQENPSYLSSLLSYVSWFIYATFIPGILILLNRRKSPLSNHDLVLIIPISLMWVMSIAPLVQILWAILNYSSPVTWWTTALISMLLTSILWVRYSLRDSRQLCFDVRFSHASPIVLFSAFVILLISIAGPLIFRNNGDNTFSMLAILAVSIIPTFFMARSKSGDMIFLYASALSLLLIPTLSSNNVSGMDIQTEYFFANSVIEKQYIDITSNYHYSTVISTQGLVPLLALWTGMPLTYVLKVLYPAIFSYCAILLYCSYDKIFNRETAYYSTLMTIFGVSFYTSMLDVVRQGFAEIFLLSAIFIMCFSDDLRMHRNRVFLVPFLISMTLAHYGINYILYPVFWCGYFFFIGLRLLVPIDFEDQLESVYTGTQDDVSTDGGDELSIFTISEDLLLDEEGLYSLEELQNLVRDLNPLLNLYHLITGTVFLVAWHSFAGGGSVIESVISYLIGILDRIEQFGIMGAFTRAQPTQFVTAELEPLHELTKYLYMLIMLLSLPSLFLSIREEPKRPSRNFICLSLASWVYFAVVFLVPNIAIRLNFPRVYHVLAIFVCPYSFKTLVDLKENLGRFGFSLDDRVATLIPKALLCSLLLLSSGFLYQFTDEGHRVYLDSQMDYAVFSDSEESGSVWEEMYGQDESLGFECRAADYYRSKLLGKNVRSHIDETQRGLDGGKYIFLSGYNLENGQYMITNAGGIDSEYAQFMHTELNNDFFNGVGNSSRIYDSGDAHWYYTGTCSF